MHRSNIVMVITLLICHIKALPSQLQLPHNDPDKLDEEDENIKDKLMRAGIPHNGILLVPGIAGSGLYMTLKNALLPDCSPRPLNQRKTRLWASLLQVLPPASHQMCWVQKISLLYNESIKCQDIHKPTAFLKTETFSNQSSDINKIELSESSFPWPVNPVDGCEYGPIPGVEVEVDPPGNTRGFDYLDYVEGIGVYGTKYFHDLITSLKLAGYVEGDTLLGHSFDWRYPIWQLNYSSMKEIIESFVKRYPNKKVTIIAHSLGGAMTNFFLNRIVDSNWKSKHIEAFIPVAAAFGGSHKAIRSLISGYGDTAAVDFFGVINVSLISTLFLRKAQRTFGSMYTLTPNLQLFGRDAQVVHVCHLIKSDPWTGLSSGCPFNKKFFSCIIKWKNLQNFYVTFLAKLFYGDMYKNHLHEIDFHDNLSNYHSVTQRRLQESAYEFDTPLKKLSMKEIVHENENLTFHTKDQTSATTTFSCNEKTKEASRLTNYTLETWWQLLPTELQERAKQAQQKITGDTALLEDPGVPVFCLWASYDFPSTEKSFTYFAGNFDIPPVVYVNGCLGQYLDCVL